MRIACRPLVSLLASTACLALLGGCRGQDTTDTEGLNAEASALVADHDESNDVESELEAGLEDPLNGATAGGDVEVSATADDAAERSRTNAGAFFQPAGCIKSTRAGNVVTHVFTNCTGPSGLRSFDGTVVATWSRAGAGLQVVYAAAGFKINGAVVDHTATVGFTRAGGVATRTRKGSSTGTTAAGRAIAHTADYVTTYDVATRCLRRDGSAQTTLGGASFSRAIAGYERCGIGLGGCPKAGTFTLSRPRVDVKLAFPGGPRVDITVNGRTVRRALVCNASAT